MQEQQPIEADFFFKKGVEQSQPQQEDYVLENIPIEISSTYHDVGFGLRSLKEGKDVGYKVAQDEKVSLRINSKAICLDVALKGVGLSQEKQLLEPIIKAEKTICLMFENISSVGRSGNKLVVLLEGHEQDQESEGDQNLQMQEKQQNWDESRNNEANPSQQQPPKQKHHAMPQILQSILNPQQSGHFNLNGNYTINLLFDHYNSSVLKEIQGIIEGFLHSDPNDMGEQDDGEDDFDMGGMISADQINEDGTIMGMDKLQEVEYDEDKQQ